MAWTVQLHAVAWSATVQTPGGVAGQFVAHQALFVALRTQQAALLVVELLLVVVVEAVPMKPPPLELLSTKGTRAWQRCTKSARSMHTWNLFFPSKHGICERQVHSNMDPLPWSFLS